MFHEPMCRHFSCILLFTSLCAHAQPDTLFATIGDSTHALHVVYDPPVIAEQYKLIGRFAQDTSAIAVQLDMKRGKPSGVYRAFYPSGRPLIFAVYGYGSLHGDWTEYNEVGRVIIKGQYRNGLRDGPWHFRQEGILGRYKKGLRHGKWKFYQNQRLVRVEKWRNDELLPGRGGIFR